MLSFPFCRDKPAESSQQGSRTPAGGICTEWVMNMLSLCQCVWEHNGCVLLWSRKSEEFSPGRQPLSGELPVSYRGKQREELRVYLLLMAAEGNITLIMYLG